MSYRLVMLWQELLKEPFKFYFGFRVTFIDSSFLAQISFATYSIKPLSGLDLYGLLDMGNGPFLKLQRLHELSRTCEYLRLRDWRTPT